MKMKKNKIYQWLVLGCLAISATACTDSVMDEINRDKNHPEDVQAKFILTDVITSTAFSVVGGDFSTYASFYVEHEVGIYNQFYNAEVRNGEPYIATTYNNTWNSAYMNIKNVKLAAGKLESDPSEQGNDVSLGIAKVLLAYNAALVTDLFGDTPFTQAGEVNPDGTPAVMQPKIDKQEDIYKDIFTLINDAILLFDGEEGGASGAIGRNDFIYGGDARLWKKAAYGLKARYLMHQLKRSTDVTVDLNAVLACVSNSFTSADEEMKFAVYNGDSQLNPLFALTTSRDGMGASASLVEKLIALNDPRANYSFMQCVNPNKYTFRQIIIPADIVTAPNGAPQQVQFKYSYSMPSLASTAPTQLLSYHELLFIKAEALARLNRAEASQTLKDAIVAAFANLENTISSAMTSVSFPDSKPSVDLSAKVAEEYFDNSIVPAFNTAPLKTVMIQKYLAFFGASGESVEAYNDYRRLRGLGESDLIELKNPNNTTKFPLRFPYGSSDVSANKEIKAAYGDGQYVYADPVWWAGGTR